MKKVIFAFALTAAAILMVAGLDKLGVFETASAQDRDGRTKSGNARMENDRKLADLIRRFADRSGAGLTQKTLPDGSDSLDLGGGFQNVMLGRLNSSGEPIAACVTSLEEANRFFEKNLDTGEPAPGGGYEPDSLESIASRHGMSKDEFLFYSKLASDTVSQQVMASPQTATITINNLDGAGEGFNDATPTAAEGGNNGATRGAQRLNLFNFAAGIWGAFLDSSVPIGVNSQFNSLTPCSSGGGVLGSAGTININRNFANAEFANTWYHAALANKRAGSDLVPGTAEMQATFNSDVDTGCLGAGSRFYYGLDNSTPAQRINLLVVLLHEMGHGLGFSSFVSGSTGVYPGAPASPDIYSRYMFDRTTGLYWHQMTDAERAASALNTNNVLWDGPNVRIASGSLTTGRDAPTGRVELFTPNPLQGGSSISHYSTAASPNLLMEPSINVGLPIDLDLTRQQMRDIGWFRDSTSDLASDTIINVTPSGGATVIGNNHAINWTNTGGFNRNVRIELSTDGGATFPTVIASSVANTGTFLWTVPNTPTTTARVRVREADFANPSGSSSANFTISSAPLAAGATIAGRVTDQAGRAISRATIVLTDSNGVARTAVTNPFGYFVFTDVPVGQTYTASVRHKRYQFEPRAVNLADDFTGLDFVAVF